MIFICNFQTNKYLNIIRLNRNKTISFLIKYYFIYQIMSIFTIIFTVIAIRATGKWIEAIFNLVLTITSIILVFYKKELLISINKKLLFSIIVILLLYIIIPVKISCDANPCYTCTYRKIYVIFSIIFWMFVLFYSLIFLI